jgi:hypothetical protein
MDENIPEVGKSPINLLGKRVAIFVLALTILIIIIFWIFKTKSDIYGPIYKGIENTSTCPNGVCNQDITNQGVDTDKDGLSDYEEENIYGTSPYLEDTDGDGMEDGEEIESGYNPNCPTGSNCGASTPMVNESVQTQQTNTTQDDLGKLIESMGALGGSESVAQQNEQELTNAFSGQANADELRNLLREYGMEEEVINQISDEDLINSYQQVLSSMGE